MQAIIMAAGRSRLKDLTTATPKALIEVGRPSIGYGPIGMCLPRDGTTQRSP